MQIEAFREQTAVEQKGPLLLPIEIGSSWLFTSLR